MVYGARIKYRLIGGLYWVIELIPSTTFVISYNKSCVYYRGQIGVLNIITLRDRLSKELGGAQMRRSGADAPIPAINIYHGALLLLQPQSPSYQHYQHPPLPHPGALVQPAYIECWAVAAHLQHQHPGRGRYKHHTIRNYNPA